MGNIAEIILELIQHPRDVLLNVATGTSTSILELVSIIFSILQRPLNLEYVDSHEAQQNLIFDTTRLKSEFPEVKFIGIREGIKGQLDLR